MANKPNRLDAAIDRLEHQLKARIEHPLRRLREAIAAARERGRLDEKRTLEEVENIRVRDRLSSNAQHLQAANEIDHLAKQLMEKAP